jgi:cytoskeletal protein CcmA (bactofilin family)
MWRKQDESKPQSQEVKTPAQNEPIVASPNVAPTPISAPSFSPRQATVPASHLTSSIVIKGEITGREDLFIDGEVQGKIHLEDGRVTIGPNGRVNADVQAREIVVRGSVRGSLQGSDRVQIGPTGRATGDIVTRLISIEEGAEVHGKVEISRSEELRATRASVVSASDEVVVPMAIHARENSSGL